MAQPRDGEGGSKLAVGKFKTKANSNVGSVREI